jgi:hypothetical protein
MINTYKILAKKPEGKRILGRPTSRWEDIRLGLMEIGCEVVDRIHLAQNRHQWWDLVNTAVFHKRQRIS